MKFDFYMLFVMVGIAIKAKEMTWKHWLLVVVIAWAWMMLLWKRY